MKNTNKIMSFVKDNTKKIIFIIIIAIIGFMIINKIVENQKIEDAKKEIIQKTQLEILVEKTNNKFANYLKKFGGSKGFEKKDQGFANSIGCKDQGSKRNGNNQLSN